MRQNTNFLTDENGEIKGRLYSAFANIRETNGLEIEVGKSDEGLLSGITNGTELRCASSNNLAKVKERNGLTILLDTPMFTANEIVLKKGDIVIISDDNYYKGNLV